MALRLPISSTHGLASSPAPISSTTTCRPAAASGSLIPPAALVAVAIRWASASASQKRGLLLTTARGGGVLAPVRSSGIETTTTSVGAEAVTGQVTEVNKDTFWPIVEAAGDKVVVLDMYTEWCGPCKVMAPKFQEMSEKNLDVVFLKLDCNQDNKVSKLDTSREGAGHKGCADVQDPQGREGREGGHRRQDRRASGSHRDSQQEVRLTKE
ncbi:thioredoxin F, chloroplastic isoform X1 [Zea mays]|uniref:Thioredoxin domain-containing protein n=1 Tax=Zea mays TaxID=4577 RepID=A0A804QSA0_MAIZE|nr:uncharacterized protein LOC100273021 isoform X1 [Zea mays]|eukprot:XP_023156507.1 uncharacterized protein LOC100273021 isoform X1 [Zea mays]